MTQHNYPKVALVLEGGGMRNSYTAACITTLLENNVQFGWVGGISAGATLTANYLSGDIARNIGSMTELATSPAAGGWSSFLRGKGYFNSDFMYHEAPVTTYEKFGPYNFEGFSNNPAEFRIGSVNAETGEMVYFGRDDVASLDDLMIRVRASSSLPGFMRPTIIDGQRYVDGAIGPGGGLAIDAAINDGYDKFLCIHTRPRDFRRSEVSRPGVLRQVFRKYPVIAEGLINRPKHYNETREQINALEKEGKALQFFPDNMHIENRERNPEKINEAYRLGYEQSQRELPRWLEFLAD